VVFAAFGADDKTSMKHFDNRREETTVRQEALQDLALISIHCPSYIALSAWHPIRHTNLRKSWRKTIHSNHHHCKIQLAIEARET
jgi:hypothetical protein